MAYALLVLAKAEDRTRTQIIYRALKHYLESYYPGNRKLENQVRTIHNNLKMWAIGVRSETLWGDQGVRDNSSSRLNEALAETLKLLLYTLKGGAAEMKLHACTLASYLTGAEALMLQGEQRTELLELVIKAEKEIESLTGIAAEERAKEETQKQPPEALESQSSKP
jgi:rRNA pseudouridine-1189 N-methylase Emg1 (Nep1/Mra1 family)